MSGEGESGGADQREGTRGSLRLRELAERDRVEQRSRCFWGKRRQSRVGGGAGRQTHKKHN